ncbi:MAG TPA: hypothetical protein VG248_05130 [Caulobacteraceae bacterium]|jgi:hypothetical protein|nr:hypothetical protein [Caulobacteraceae bacterium]
MLRAMMALSVALVSTTEAVAAAASNADAAAVWAREGEYWVKAKQTDLGPYFGLFRSDFRGWPCGESSTRDLTALKHTGPPIRPSEEVRLDERETTSAPGLVLVFYRATLTDHGGPHPGAVRVRYFTHTWTRGAAGWQILGGMCRDAPP